MVSGEVGRVREFGGEEMVCERKGRLAIGWVGWPLAVDAEAEEMGVEGVRGGGGWRAYWVVLDGPRGVGEVGG